MHFRFVDSVVLERRKLRPSSCSPISRSLMQCFGSKLMKILSYEMRFVKSPPYWALKNEKEATKPKIRWLARSLSGMAGRSSQGR